MSFYSLGKNEVRYLHQKAAQLKSELQNLEKSSGNVSSFQAIRIQSEINKIQNKIKVLTFGNNTDGDDIA